MNNNDIFDENDRKLINRLNQLSNEGKVDTPEYREVQEEIAERYRLSLKSAAEKEKNKNN
jgi:hypothetical protein